MTPFALHIAIISTIHKVCIRMHVLEREKERVLLKYATVSRHAHKHVFAHACRKEGREEGRKEGRREGRQQGRKEGRQAGVHARTPLLLACLISSRVGWLDAAILAALSLPPLYRSPSNPHPQLYLEPAER